MASGIFALLDDIASLMDDMAVMSKVAAKKKLRGSWETIWP